MNTVMGSGVRDIQPCARLPRDMGFRESCVSRHVPPAERSPNMPQPPLSPKEQAVVAEYEYWRARQAHLEASLETPSTPNDRYQASQYQARADEAYRMHGRSAPAQREGESAETYRRRLLTGLKEYHPELKDFDFCSMKQQVVVDNFEKEVFKAALDPASHAIDCPPGMIKEIRTKDPITGRDRSEFISSDGHTFIHDMARPGRRTYSAGGKFIDPLKFQATGYLAPTDTRANAPDSMRPMRAGPQALHRGFPR
jgi:hypothetical protein